MTKRLLIAEWEPAKIRPNAQVYLRLRDRAFGPVGRVLEVRDGYAQVAFPGSTVWCLLRSLILAEEPDEETDHEENS